MERLATRIATTISGARRRVIVAAFAAGFLLLYGPIVLAMLVFDRHLHWVDTVAVVAAAFLAAIVPAWVAHSKLPHYPGTARERSRENLAWYVIAAGGLTVLVARLIYAWRELSVGGAVDSVLIADVLFGVSVVFFLGGLLNIPWSPRRHRPMSAMLNALIVLIATGTLFWPILFGPALAGEFQELIALPVLSNYLVAVFILTFAVLWIVMKDIREDLWPTAVAFVVSIGFMILIQVGYLAFLATSDDGAHEFPLLMVNAASVASFLMIALAAMLRVGSLNREHDPSSEAVLLDEEAPIQFWQVILPYPLLMMLILVRLAMELLEWQLEYRTGMLIGFGMIIVLMMFWQIPLLRFNQDLYRRLAVSSIRDGLTGLFTHRALHDLLHTEVARAQRNRTELAVLFMDIDRFKSFNDTYGHQSGDDVLVSVADIIKQNVRTSDLAGRYGGEEFMVIAPDISRADATQLSERLRRSLVEQEFIFDGERIDLTMSIGVSLYPDDSEDPEDLIDLSDQAMYQAKQSGRNQTVMHGWRTLLSSSTG